MVKRSSIDLLKFLFISLVFLSTSVHAITECQVKTAALYVGDNGIVWLEFTNGGSTFLEAGDPNLNNIYTLALAAQMSDKSIVVRYEADNVPCNTVRRGDVRGVWLYR